MIPSTNVNKVPLKQWRRWSARARATFNTTYDCLYENQTLANHPKAIPQSPAHWKTLSWNAAWIAADAVDDVLPPTIVEDIDMKAGRTVKKHNVKTTLHPPKYVDNVRATCDSWRAA